MMRVWSGGWPISPCSWANTLTRWPIGTGKDTPQVRYHHLTWSVRGSRSGPVTDRASTWQWLGGTEETLQRWHDVLEARRALAH